jgi:hypothetical protein
MKKHLLLIAIAFIFTLSTKAQGGMTNLSFETWGTTIFSLQPTGWLAMTGSQQTVGAQAGTKYVRITTTNTTTNQDGMLFLGRLVGSSFHSGDAIAQNPSSIKGFYKTSGLGTGDTVGIEALLFSQTNYISLAKATTTANVSAWTSFSASFSTYFQNADTIIIFAFSNAQMVGGGPNKIGSTLDLDNLSFTYLTGIDELSIGTAFLVYPNPANSELNIISKDENATRVVISDLSGRRVKELEITDEETKIDLQDVSAGIYVYSILNKDGAKLLSNKFAVTK